MNYVKAPLQRCTENMIHYDPLRSTCVNVSQTHSTPSLVFKRVLMMIVTIYLLNKIGTFLKKYIYLNQLKNNSAKSHISKMKQATEKQVTNQDY